MKKYCSRNLFHSLQFSSVQSLSHIWLFATPHITAHQASMSITNSQRSLKLMSIELVMPFSHSFSVTPFSSCPQSLPKSGSFPMSWGGQGLEFQLQHQSFQWTPRTDLLPRTGWISLQSKGLSRVFSNTTIQKHQFFGAQLSSHSSSHIHKWLLEKP